MRRQMYMSHISRLTFHEFSIDSTLCSLYIRCKAYLASTFLALSLTPYPFPLLLNSTKSSTLSCSARLSKIGFLSIVSSNKFLTAFLSILRRWLNAVFTRVKKKASLLISKGTALGMSLITALFTLGGGLKHCSCTSKDIPPQNKPV